MIVTHELGCFSVNVRYLDNVTVARVIPMEEGKLQYGQSASGVSYLNPLDEADSELGKELAIERALYTLGFDDGESEAFLMTLRALNAHYAR